jgi:hypothetical protein
MGIMIGNKRVLDMQYLGKKAISAMLNGDCVYATKTKKSGSLATVSDAANVNIKSLQVGYGSHKQPIYSGINLIDWANPTTKLGSFDYDTSTDYMYVNLGTSSSNYVEWDITEFAKKNIGKTLYLNWNSFGHNNCVIGVVFDNMFYDFTQNSMRVTIRSASKTSIKIKKSSSTTSPGYMNIKQPLIGYSFSTTFEPYVGREPSPSANYPQDVVYPTGEIKVKVTNGLANTDSAYKENIVTASLGGETLRVFDNYDVATGVLTKKCKELVLNGSFGTWKPYSMGSLGYYFVSNDVLGDNELIAASTIGLLGESLIKSGTRTGMYFKQTSATTYEVGIYVGPGVTSITSWLASHLVKVYTQAPENEWVTVNLEPVDIRLFDKNNKVTVSSEFKEDYYPINMEYYVR